MRKCFSVSTTFDKENRVDFSDSDGDDDEDQNLKIVVASVCGTPEKADVDVLPEVHACCYFKLK